MINQFSNEPTSCVYEYISNDPELFEDAVRLVVKDPANAPQEIRSWVEDCTRNKRGDDLTSRLVQSSLRQVRWTELRQVLQADAKRYLSS